MPKVEKLFVLHNPIELPWGTVTSLQLIYTEWQACWFLLANGVDRDKDGFTEVLSVNLKPHVGSHPDKFFIRTDEANADLVRELTNRGILVDTGIRHVSGYIRIPLFSYDATADHGYVQSIAPETIQE